MSQTDSSNALASDVPAEVTYDDFAFNFAEIFHVALRRGVDGHASVITYNMLHFMPDHVRSSFYSHVSGLLKAETLTAARLRDAALSWCKSYEGEDRDQAAAFNSALSLHPSEDWVSITQFMRSCEIAPEASYESDILSLWEDGSGFQTTLQFHDKAHRLIGTAKSHAYIDNKDEVARLWLVDIHGLKGFRVQGSIEALPDVITRAKEAVSTERLRFLESRVRPELVEQHAGNPLQAPLDPEDPVDARLLAELPLGAEVLLRYICRENDSYTHAYFVGIPHLDESFGMAFHHCWVSDHGVTVARRSSNSTVERRLADGTGIYRFGVDHDLVQKNLKFSVDGNNLTVRATIEKKGSDARMLSESERTFTIGHEPQVSETESAANEI